MDDCPVRAFSVKPTPSAREIPMFGMKRREFILEARLDIVGDFTIDQFAITNQNGNAFITLAPSTPVSAGLDVNGVDSVNLDRQVAQLISAMASHLDGNSGLGPMSMPTQPQTDSILQSTLAPAGHS